MLKKIDLVLILIVTMSSIIKHGVSKKDEPIRSSFLVKIFKTYHLAIVGFFIYKQINIWM